MKRYFLLILVLFSYDGYAEALTCGNSQAVVLNSNESEFPFFGVALFHSKYQKNYKLHVSSDFFKIKCTEDLVGKKYFLISHSCGGTSCLNNYGLIDSSNGNFVVYPDMPRVSPSERNKLKSWGNNDEIEAVLKKKPEYFSCKSREVTKTEVCFVSNLELG